jgi:hypothetical protein
MRLRSPAEYYIKYLVSHPHKYPVDEIQERLIDEGLDFISPVYLTRVRSKLKLPKPFRPEDPHHTPSLAFILKTGINRLYMPDLSMKIAQDVLACARAKEFVETALISRAPMAAIAHMVTKHFQVYCTSGALEVYHHYFWNTDLFDTIQLQVLLSMRAEIAEKYIPEFKGHAQVLRSAYFRDARKVAAEMPYSPMGAMLAQTRLGFAPTRSEVSLRMMEAKSLALLRACEALQRGGPHDSQNALNNITSARILEELTQMTSKPEGQMLEQVQSIALRTDTQPMKSIHQLSDGRHTVDVAPMKDPLHDDTDAFDDTGDPDSGPGDIDGSE